jgi:hypothetical protein
MSEDHRIISPPRGEPRSPGDVGVRVRVQLSGRPSRRWSRHLAAQLTLELAGNPSTSRLRVNVTDLVQGDDDIVLDGVEDRDTTTLAAALRHAVDAANRTQGDNADQPTNVTQRDADRVASHIPLSEARPQAATREGDDPPCRRCGQPVPVVATGDRADGDQLVLREVNCPSCGAHLVRSVEGHTDHGWSLGE